MDDAAEVISGYIEHRLAREQEILDAIATGAGTVADIVDAVYEFVPADLRGAATHQVIVQLNKLLADERVRFSAGAAGPSTMVELIARQ
jgi:phage-related baseplate assembly protein